MRWGRWTHPHFDVVLAAVAAGRHELIRLHRAGDIDNETLNEWEPDLEELGAFGKTLRLNRRKKT